MLEKNKVLTEAEEFINDFSDKISGNGLSDSAKQVLFLDNQQKIKDTMGNLNDIKSDFELEDTDKYDFCISLMNKLTKTLKDYRNSCSKINPDITVEDTTPVITAETIKEAVKNNASTQQMINDLKSVNFSPITYAIFVGNKLTYTDTTNMQELNELINNVADMNPNEKVEVYKVTLTNVPLKTKTIYTV